ncbi:MAG: hypothetical protein HY540_06570 [Deltaproteobacteria bacterium]|nr:hypothetical protein [Deltaproteobacteria bacterium]
MIFRYFLMLILLFSSPLYAASPQMASFEIKTGFWLPEGTFNDIFSPCCNLITKIQSGLLFNRQVGVEAGVGFLTKGGQAISANGTPSQDRFRLYVIPLETNFVIRAEDRNWRYFAPYFKLGSDCLLYQEKTGDNTIKGIKYGLHGVGGIQIQLTKWSDGLQTLDQSTGINDLFLTLEAAYQWINNFGGEGANFSGQLYSAGLLFEF